MEEDSFYDICYPQLALSRWVTLIVVCNGQKEKKINNKQFIKQRGKRIK